MTQRPKLILVLVCESSIELTVNHFLVPIRGLWDQATHGDGQELFSIVGIGNLPYQNGGKEHLWLVVNAVVRESSLSEKTICIVHH